MRQYLIKRVTTAFLVLLVAMSIQFFLFQVVSPIDPTSLFIDPQWTKEQADLLRKQWGLEDKNYFNRYLVYLKNMLTWNYGVSFWTGKSVNEEMVWRLRNTVILLGTALVAVATVGISLGILAASRRGKNTDAAIMSASLVTFGIPTFFIQLLFIYFFTFYLPYHFNITIFPEPGGLVRGVPTGNVFELAAEIMWHVALPVITIVASGFGSWALYTRNMMVDALTEDFILTAQAQGFSERIILLKHAFKSILPPVATMITLAIPGIVTGAIITEYLFAWPGIGRWYIDALMKGDYPVVQAVMYQYSVLMISCNLIADLLYGFLDPRIRTGMKG